MGGLLNLSRAEYEQLRAENWSMVRHLAKSPAHYAAAKRLGTRDSDAKRRGRVVHMAIFEPERYSREVVTYEGKRDKRIKEYSAFLEVNAGKEILTPDEAAEIGNISDAVRSSVVARPYLEGLAEQTALWAHNVNGVEVACKGRFDLVGSHLVDLKTTKDASLRGFEWECSKFRTHIAMAWYADGLEMATGERKPVALIAVEAEFPYPVVVRLVPDGLLEIGRSEFMSYLRLLVACRNANAWPGYADGPVTLEMTARQLGTEQEAP